MLLIAHVYVKITARPSTMEVEEANISSQAVKRRLPREVKQKLAKVARLAVLVNFPNCHLICK